MMLSPRNLFFFHFRKYLFEKTSAVDVQFCQKLQDPIKIVETYHDLCDIIELVNSAFTFPMIFVVLNCFILNLFSFFTLVWYFVRDFQYFHYPIITDAPWIISNYLLQAILIHACCKTTSEAEKFPIIITNFINTANCNKFGKKVFKSFLIQNQYRNVKFRTVFSTIDWKLLLAVSRING